MKKKGFTLIELLAVIVILAIIALIATPIIINIISDSREESNKRSVELYGKAVEQAIAKSQLNGSEIAAGDLSSSLLSTVEYSGNEVTCTTNKLYEDGSIYLAGCRVGTDTKEYTYGKQMVVKLCTANTTQAQAYVWPGNVPPEDIGYYDLQEVGLLASESGAYTPGVTYTCELGDGKEETFYVLEENGNEVTLLLGRNLGGSVSWCSREDCGDEWDDSTIPITAMNAIKERTTGWTKLQDSQISMPTAQQIANAAGQTLATSDDFDYINDLPTWIISYTEDIVDNSHGYWTKRFYSDYYCPGPDDPCHYLYFPYGVYLNSLTHHMPDNRSVRPVITISKSNLS